MIRCVVASKWIHAQSQWTHLPHGLSLNRLFFITRRLYSDQIPSGEQKRTRNIGIIAHIDAGKTTTTERMLYYSGFTRRIGDVDDGSTVTDFLPAERARGITIQSAAVTFDWPPNAPNEPEKKENSSHRINLIDTPGHADFTFEVLRSLRILDGAVCILDGVAGVEAQTEQVWHQASKYQIPRIAYVNKLDRDGAAFGRTVREIGSRLVVWPAVCQIPWFEGGKGRFTGVGDVINLKGLLWNEGGDGKQVKVFDLQRLSEFDLEFSKELRKARCALVELLSEHDDIMVERFLEHEEDHLAVRPKEVIQSLRKCLLGRQSKIIPVFAGASFRNIGVQPLLDAVTSLLPNPAECPDAEVSIASVKGGLQDLLQGKLLLEQPKHDQKHKTKRKQLPAALQTREDLRKLEGCALAFKVVSDAKRGVLVYVRVYYGTLDRNSTLFNTNLNVSEKAPRLLKMYANDAVEIESIPAGQIGVVVGLKHARTGDTLVSYPSNKPTLPEPLNTLQLRPIDVPPPVFFASLEPHSLSEEKNVAEALALLLREDPSLHVTVDEDSGQTQLSGMGELHLEIARDRLVNDFKAKTTMGRIEINYRECILTRSEPHIKILERMTAGKASKAGCEAQVEPFNPDEAGHSEISPLLDKTHVSEEREGNRITIITPTLDWQGSPIDPEDAALPSHLSLSIAQSSLMNGALAGLARGPRHSYPVHRVHVLLTLNPSAHIFGSETTPAALSSAARLAVQAAMKESANKGGSSLMEPVMNVIISVDEASIGPVVHDISSSRGGHVVSLDEDVPTTFDGAVDEIPAIDVKKIYAPPDPFEAPSVAQREDTLAASNRPRTIAAKVPLKEMVGYLKHLRSLTGGRGTFVMNVDRFEKMSPQREKMALASMTGSQS
jgi:elongation factor G